MQVIEITLTGKDTYKLKKDERNMLRALGLNERPSRDFLKLLKMKIKDLAKKDVRRKI